MRGLRSSLLTILCGAFTSSLLASWQLLPAGYPYVETLVADTSGQRIMLSCYNNGMWQSEDGGNLYRREA